jgi:hypothetical protein
LITKEQFQDFLLEHQKEEKSFYEIEQIIYVNMFSLNFLFSDFDSLF